MILSPLLVVVVTVLSHPRGDRWFGLHFDFLDAMKSMLNTSCFPLIESVNTAIISLFQQTRVIEFSARLGLN